MKQDDNYQLPSNLDKDEILEHTDNDELLNIGYVFIKYIYQQLKQLKKCLVKNTK